MFEPVVGATVEEASYVLQFTGSELLGLSNIEFIGTVGILGAELISVVAIEQCKFRYVIHYKI